MLSPAIAHGKGSPDTEHERVVTRLDRANVYSLSTKCRQSVDKVSTEIRQIRRGHEPARNEGVQTGSVYMTYTNVDPRFTLTQTRGCLDPHKGSHCDITSKSRQNLQKFDKMSTKCRQNVDRMPKISANADSLRQIFQSRIDAKCRLKKGPV